MMIVYGLGLLYAFNSTASAPSPLQDFHPSDEADEEMWSVKTAIGVLVLSTVFIAWMSEMMVETVEPVLEHLGWTEFFLGVIIIPIIGNVAEHLVAVQVAIKDQMDMSLEVSLGSSLQIALLVSPLLVFVSLLIGHPLTLVFNQFELIALAAAALIAALVALDGESNWLEGAQLLVVYVILGIAFFFLPM